MTAYDPQDPVTHPDAEPTYVHEQAYPWQPQPGYGQQAYGQPEYGHPEYGHPGYGQAGYGQPAYGTPTPESTGYGQYPYAPSGYPPYGSTGHDSAAGYYGTTGYPTGYYGGYPGQYPPPPPPAPAGPSTVRRVLIGVGTAALAVGLVLSGMAIAHDGTSGTATAGQLPGSTAGGGTGSLPGNGATGGAGSAQGGSGSGSGSGSGTAANAHVASATQQIGIVTIVSVLGYQNAESAGTGMVISSDGNVLTNNHVINGATSITVTVESTGKSYRADVVGTVPTRDVAVIKLRDASGLTTAKLGGAGDVDALKIGDAVTGVGNAGGTGTLRAADGTVSALDQSITASDETGSSSEKLTGLIQIDAGVVSGDSGGPLYNAGGTVVGMDTAASADRSESTAYAIAIDDALGLARQIESGARTTTVHIGLPAFIGVTVDPQVTGGAGIQRVLQGGPADKAGLASGSVITTVDGTAVADATSLKTLLSAHAPGDRVQLTWTDASGQRHTATVTTVAGPAD